MILIADSGSTKTHWKVICAESVVYDFETQGLNPYHYSQADFEELVVSSIGGNCTLAEVTTVHFYGAGCASPVMAQRVKNALATVLNIASINIYPDILGAARALFGSKQGLVIVLGTGANVGYYNGLEVTHRTPSLGYILGDEGSGAYLGRLLLRKWLYGELSPAISDELKSFCPLSLTEVLSLVYGKSAVATFFSSFMPFIISHRECPEIEDIIYYSFNELVRNHIVKYEEFPRCNVGVVGSIGVILLKYLTETITQNGGTVNASLQYPIENLVRYHTSLKTA